LHVSVVWKNSNFQNSIKYYKVKDSGHTEPANTPVVAFCALVFNAAVLADISLDPLAPDGLYGNAKMFHVPFANAAVFLSH
jgi:hypothetical protein